MKRRLGALTLGLCLAAALCTPALAAAAPAAPVVEHKTADSFTVTYQGTAKNQYVLLVVKAGTDLNSLTADSILYIDQAAADENGVAAFANLTDSTKGFLLKSSQSADVYVGGAELAAPAASKFEEEKVGQDGTYTGGGIYFAGVPVSGTVAFQESSVAAAVTLYDAQGEQVASVSTDASGAYRFECVPLGNGYKLVVTKPGYCSYTISNISIQEESVLQPVDIQSGAGDVNGNGEINVYDLTELLGEFNRSGEQIQNSKADINGNGTVNVYDLTYLLSNFNHSSIIVDAAGEA